MGHGEFLCTSSPLLPLAHHSNLHSLTVNKVEQKDVAQEKQREWAQLITSPQDVHCAQGAGLVLMQVQFVQVDGHSIRSGVDVCELEEASRWNKAEKSLDWGSGSNLADFIRLAEQTRIFKTTMEVKLWCVCIPQSALHHWCDTVTAGSKTCGTFKVSLV